MNMKEEYRKSDHKVDFFQQLSFQEQVRLTESLNQEELKELFHELSIVHIQRIIRELNSVKKQEIYNVLERDKLDAIYRNSSSDEQREMQEQLERIQAISLSDIEHSQRNILNSSNNIIRNINNIENSKEKIESHRNDIKQAQKEIKVNIKDSKRVEKIRQRLEKRTLKLSRKANVGLFQKRKLRRLENLHNQLMEVNKLKTFYTEKNSELETTIHEYESKIEQEERNIEKATSQIERDKNRIKNETQKVKENREAIAKLDKTEKSIFGRKMYQKTVHLRDHYLTTMKKEELEKINKALEEKARKEKEKKEQQEKEKALKEQQKKEEEAKKEENTKKEEKIQEPVVVSNQDTQVQNQTQQNVQNIAAILQTLMQNGLNQMPIVPLQSSNHPDLLKNEVNTITAQNLVTLAASLGYYFELGRRQAMEQERQQALAEGQKRILGKRSAFVSLPIIILIIMALIVISAISIILMKV